MLHHQFANEYNTSAMAEIAKAARLHSLMLNRAAVEATDKKEAAALRRQAAVFESLWLATSSLLAMQSQPTT